MGELEDSCVVISTAFSQDCGLSHYQGWGGADPGSTPPGCLTPDSPHLPNQASQAPVPWGLD